MRNNKKKAWPDRRKRNKNVEATRKSDELNGVLGEAVLMMGEGVLEEDKIREIRADRVKFQNDKWMTYMSKGADFLDGVLALLENSGTLSAVIRQKCVLLFGGGLTISRGTRGVFSLWKKLLERVGIDDQEVKELDEFLGDINLEEESLIEVGAKGMNDFMALGNGLYEMVRGKDNDGKFFYLNHWDASKVRILPEKTKGGKITRNRQVGLNEDWASDEQGKNATKVTVYPHWIKMDDGTERSVIHVKDYMRGFKYWGVPSWWSVKRWVELEYRVAAYNVFKFVNGYMPSAIVQFFGAKNKTEAQSIVDRAKKAFTDTGNNSKIFFQVLSDEKYKANVQVIADKNEGSFMELTKLAVQRVVTGLEWAMSIVGVETSGKLGNNQQVKREYERVNNMVIEPMRDMFLKKVVNVVVSEAAEYLEKKGWQEFVVGFGNNSIYSLQDSIDVNSVAGLNEKRRMLGLNEFNEDEKNEFFNEKSKMNGTGNRLNTSGEGGGE